LVVGRGAWSIVDPEAEPAEERVLVVSEAAVRRELVQLSGVAAAEHDVVRLQRVRQVLDRLEDRLPPALEAAVLEPALADVVLERGLAEGEMPELHRCDDALEDHRRPESRAEAEEEHPTALVRPERLHG